MRRFRLRRLEKVNIEAILIASGQNAKLTFRVPNSFWIHRQIILNSSLGVSMGTTRSKRLAAPVKGEKSCQKQQRRGNKAPPQQIQIHRRMFSWSGCETGARRKKEVT
jgi:hypothetical protein